MSFSAPRSRQRSSQYFLFLDFFEVETKAYVRESVRVFEIALASTLLALALAWALFENC